MRINNDIWVFLEEDIHAFQSIQLCNATVVVHAFDFLNYILRVESHPMRYGGDYLLMREEFSNIFDVFAKCKITPVFVFGGTSATTETEVNESLHRLHRRLCFLENAPYEISRIDQRSSYFSTPVFAKEMLIDVLKQRNLPYAICNAGNVPGCVSLASYLRCPVLGNSSEFLLFDIEEPDVDLDRFLYIPLRYLSVRPVPKASDPKSLCLNVKALSSVNCVLQRIPHLLRPFFALYFKPPNASYFPLPYEVYSTLKQQETGSEEDNRTMTKRAKALVAWLGPQKPPLSALEDCVKNLKEKKIIVSLFQELVSICNFLKVNLDHGEELARYMSLVRQQNPRSVEDPQDLVSYLIRQNPTHEPLKLYVDLLQTESSVTLCEMSQFLLKVPQKFLYFYRSGFLSAVVFNRVLSNMVLLPVMEESLNRESITEASKSLRYLQYCLFLQFVQWFNLEVDRWTGNSDRFVTELTRSKDTRNVNLCKFKLTPMDVIRHCDPQSACVSFMKRHINYPSQRIDTTQDMLALTLMLWHLHTQNGVEIDILELPTCLAVVLIYSSMVASGGKLTAANLSELADSMPCAFDVDVAHEIAELQMLYISLVSLLRFAGVVCICESEGDSNAQAPAFPGAECIFPSSRLIHNLAVTLKSSPDRKLLNFWLGKLLSPLQSDAYTQRATIQVIQFMRLLHVMKSVKRVEFPCSRGVIPMPVARKHSGPDKTNLAKQDTAGSRLQELMNRSDEFGISHTRSNVTRSDLRSKSNANAPSPRKNSRRSYFGRPNTKESRNEFGQQSRFINNQFDKSCRSDARLEAMQGSATLTSPIEDSNSAQGRDSTNPFLADCDSALKVSQVASSQNYNPFAAGPHYAASEYGDLPQFQSRSRSIRPSATTSEYCFRSSSGNRYRPDDRSFDPRRQRGNGNRSHGAGNRFRPQNQGSFRSQKSGLSYAAKLSMRLNGGGGDGAALPYTGDDVPRSASRSSYGASDPRFGSENVYQNTSNYGGEPPRRWYTPNGVGGGPRGGSFRRNDGNQRDRTLKDQSSFNNKQAWDSKETAAEIEKLAAMFS